ncbi:hypothetical protein VDGL01_09309 [Verticillium dahliae]
MSMSPSAAATALKSNADPPAATAATAAPAATTAPLLLLLHQRYFPCDDQKHQIKSPLPLRPTAYEETARTKSLHQTTACHTRPVPALRGPSLPPPPSPSVHRQRRRPFSTDNCQDLEILPQNFPQHHLSTSSSLPLLYSESLL